MPLRNVFCLPFMSGLLGCHVGAQVAQAHEWFLLCLVFAIDLENKFYFKYT